MTDKQALETALEHLKAFRGRYEHPANLCHLGLTTGDLDVIIERLERTKGMNPIPVISMAQLDETYRKDD